MFYAFSHINRFYPQYVEKVCAIMILTSAPIPRFKKVGKTIKKKEIIGTHSYLVYRLLLSVPMIFGLQFCNFLTYYFNIEYNIKYWIDLL